MPLIEATCPLKWESTYGGVYDAVSPDFVTGRPFVCFRLRPPCTLPETPDNAAENPASVSEEKFETYQAGELFLMMAAGKQSSSHFLCPNRGHICKQFKALAKFGRQFAVRPSA